MCGFDLFLFHLEHEMSKTNFERNRILDLRYGDGSYSKPATVYIALFTAAPTVAGGGTEVTGGSYARVAITNDLANWADAVAGVKSNALAITFPTATAGWGVVTHFAIFDAPTAGNMLDFAELKSGGVPAPKTIANGDTPSFSAGQIQLTET
jgi:hypothetical protein